MELKAKPAGKGAPRFFIPRGVRKPMGDSLENHLPTDERGQRINHQWHFSSVGEAIFTRRGVHSHMGDSSFIHFGGKECTISLPQDAIPSSVDTVTQQESVDKPGVERYSFWEVVQW
ncbi:MAG: hypothetical protein ABIN58_08845 [candidate division WOR-3 bacterium]